MTMSMTFPDIPEPSQGEPVSADWARRIARILRSMRITGGPGVRVSTTPSGTTVSAARGRRTENPEKEVPQPFTLRIRKDGDTSVLEIYIPDAKITNCPYVVRNGRPIAYEGEIPDDGWAYVEDLDGGEFEEHVYVVIGLAERAIYPTEAPTHHLGELAWHIETTTSDSALGVSDMCRIMIGTVSSDGPTARNVACGHFQTDWVQTDEEVAAIAHRHNIGDWPTSITRDDANRPYHAPYGAIGIYGFFDPESTEPSDAEDALVMVRHPGTDGVGPYVAYVPLSCFATSDTDDGGWNNPPSWSPPSPDSDCSTTPNDPKHLYAWNSCTQGWVRLSAAAGAAAPLDARYWLLGGNSANCYGAEIGDTNKRMVIDLSAKELEGEWVAHGSKFTIDGDAIVGGVINLSGVDVGIQTVQSGNSSGIIVADAGGIGAINDLKSRIASLESRLAESGIA